MRQLSTTQVGRLGLVAAGVLVGAFAVARLPAALSAFNPQPDPPGTQKFPPLSVTADMNVRVNVANTKFLVDSSERPCAVVLYVFDAEGNIIAQERKLLSARQSAFLDVPGSQILSGRTDPRAQIWAAVVPARPAVCQVNTSLELVDAVTGRTEIAIGAPNTIGDPGL